MATRIPLGPIHSAPWGAIKTELLEPNQPVYEKVLRDALAGVELGAYDEDIVVWVSGLDCPTVATLASLLYRLRALGCGCYPDPADHEERCPQRAEVDR
ncbi:hypothetical protein [Nonomuraea sp. NPDC050643]|uniref:hypothetical protein n=1 Tax=Nonomuraea sp. NPDC050643 TaxID=3155660 RepID=UPI0033D2EF19